MRITLFYVPFGSEENAKAVGLTALEKKLAACINIFPIQSAYSWQGRLQHDHEFVLILKTFPEYIASLEKHVKDQHAYEVPAILHWDADVNEEYAAWMRAQL